MSFTTITSGGREKPWPDWTGFVDTTKPGYAGRPAIEWLRESHQEMFCYRDGAKFANCGIVEWSLLEHETDGELRRCSLFIRVPE